MSVRLAERLSTAGRRGSRDRSAVLVLETIDAGRLRAAKRPPNCASRATSRFGSFLWIQRRVDMSSGAKPNLQAFPAYLGNSASSTVIGMHSQKYADGKRKR
jgi:hypothetical protein